MAFALKMALAATMAAADVPADVTYNMGDDEHTLAIKDGKVFQVKIVDLISTGFNWYLDSLPSGVNMLSNTTGGGADEPPYIMCEMSASKEFKAGDVSWVHVKPWEINNQDAERGHAILHLNAAAASSLEVSAVVPAAVPADATFHTGDSDHSLTIHDGKEFQVKIIDLATSTGFHWYLDALPSGVKMLSNVSGGGADEPPYIMCKMSASASFKAGDVSWVHVKPWEMNNHDAERGHAVLHLKAAADSSVEVSAEVPADAPADVTYNMGDSDHSLTIHDGKDFQVKIIDLLSTGFSWYLDALPSGVTMLSNVSGGGADEPPYIMCKMSASESFKAGDVSWVHVKPWEMNNQDAERGHAVLHLTAAGIAQSEILV